MTRKDRPKIDHKKKSKLPKKSYNIDFKIRALLLLRSYDFNYTKASKELNVHYMTLHNWKEKHGAEAYKDDNIQKEYEDILSTEREKRIEKVRKNFLDREKDYIDKIYDIRERAAERLMDVVVNSKDIRALNDTLRTAQEIITGEHIKTLEERKMSSRFFHTVVNQFTTVNNINQHIKDNEGQEDNRD